MRWLLILSDKHVSDIGLTWFTEFSGRNISSVGHSQHDEFKHHNSVVAMSISISEVDILSNINLLNDFNNSSTNIIMEQYLFQKTKLKFNSIYGWYAL